jgi:hypothetical protein
MSGYDSYDSVDDYSKNDNDDYRRGKIQDKINSLYNYDKLCIGCKRMYMEISLNDFCQQCQRQLCWTCWRMHGICESCIKEKDPTPPTIVCGTHIN